MSTAADRRRRRYLEIALDLFGEHGFTGTSTDLIVATAGGSKATLYRYFPSKQHLLDGLIADLIAGVNRAHPATADPELPLADALTRIGRNALATITSARGAKLTRILLGELHRYPELARRFWDSGPAVTYANFAAFVAQRTARGEVHVDDPQLAAEHFLAGLVGHLQPKAALGLIEPLTDAEIDRRVAASVLAWMSHYARR